MSKTTMIVPIKTTDSHTAPNIKVLNFMANPTRKEAKMVPAQLPRSAYNTNGKRIDKDMVTGFGGNVAQGKDYHRGQSGQSGSNSHCSHACSIGIDAQH